jgi:exopolyphosphatase/pppGpp-phosphohydrolase
MTLSAEEIRSWGLRLSGMTMDERKQVEGLMPHRADIIPSGIAILDAAMSSLGIPVMRLSARGNLDGYMKKIFKKGVDNF